MQSTPLVGRTVLIVEDEALISLDIAKAFEVVGATVLAAATLASAVQLVESEGLSTAVIDFWLGHCDADVVCVRLKERNIPFILHSGYSHISNCHGGVVVPKPASPSVLVDTVVKLLHWEPSRRLHVANEAGPNRGCVG
jgi:DNA-binding NtrC family response regulator